MLKYKITPVTSFMQNCTILWCDETQQAAIIDPGGDSGKIKQIVDELALKIGQILLTHGHIDHVAAAKELSEYYQVKIIGPHRSDNFWFEALPLQSEHFGLPSCTTFRPDQWLKEGDVIQIGNQMLNVFHCPGHTPGHIALFSQSEKLAIVGDVLFSGSIGRTDFPLSSYDDLILSIQNKLWPLGDDVLIIPGHGPMSSIGNERKHNPYVGEEANQN